MSVFHPQTIHLQLTSIVHNCIITCYNGVDWEKYIADIFGILLWRVWFIMPHSQKIFIEKQFMFGKPTLNTFNDLENIHQKNMSGATLKVSQNCYVCVSFA